MKTILFLAATGYAATLNSTSSASPISSSITTSPVSSTPIVKLDYGTFSGQTVDGINSFLGIPFAQQPIGNLRLRVPLPPISLGSEIIPAIAYGPACPQQFATNPPKNPFAGNPLLAPLAGILNALSGSSTNFTSEACLSLNVIAPVVKKGEKLPVLVWIYGGGFTGGYTALYDGTPIVKRAIQNGQKVIFVSMNYRLAGFGFLGGKELKAEGNGNLGLQDQREALRWVQKNIEKFGGSREKVTIFGESAGAISASLQIVSPLHKKEKLFRSAILLSGSPTPQGDMASKDAQLSYDRVVQFTGCDKAKNSLQCLREVSFERFNDAVNAQAGLGDYASLALVFKPRVDGVFLTEDPFKSVKQGNFDHVPIISGDCDDEGSIFSLTMLNETTEAGFRNFVKQQFAPTISEVDLNELALAYPSNANLGSPYDTGLNNSLTPQFKRFASFQGDFVFQSPRRLFFEYAKSPVYSYIYKVGKKTPFLGAFHGSDIRNEFFAPGTGSVDGQFQFIDYAINFVHHLTPNREIFSRKNLLHWPKYCSEEKKLLTFSDKEINGTGLSITRDTYRQEEMKQLLKFSTKYAELD